MATDNIKPLSPTSSTPAMDPSQTPEEPSNIVESANGFQNCRLTDTEQDEVLIDLAHYLLKENLTAFAENTVTRVEDMQNFNYLGCVAKISVQQGNLAAAIPALEQMLELKNTWLDGYIQIGNAYFKQGESEKALQAYLKAIRVSNLTGQEISDQLVF